MTVDSIFPSTIKAGLTLDQLVTLTAYPAPTWVLSVYLRGPSAINLTADAEDTQHHWDVNAATTAAWAPGLYSYSARVTGADGVFEVDSGSVEILPDLAAIDDPYDGRTHARRVLDAIEAVLEKRASKDQERYTIEGPNGGRRELWRTPLADLLKLRETYRAQVRNEERKSRGQSLFGVAVRVRF